MRSDTTGQLRNAWWGVSYQQQEVLNGTRNSSLSVLCNADQFPRDKMPALQGPPTQCPANESRFFETGGWRLRDDCRGAVVGSDAGSRVVRVFGDGIRRAGAGSVHPLVVGDATRRERAVTGIPFFSVDRRPLLFQFNSPAATRLAILGGALSLLGFGNKLSLLTQVDVVLRRCVLQQKRFQIFDAGLCAWQIYSPEKCARRLIWAALRLIEQDQALYPIRNSATWNLPHHPPQLPPLS